MGCNNPEWATKLLEMMKEHPSWTNSTFAERLGLTPKQVGQFKYNHKQEIADYQKEHKEEKTVEATATPTPAQVTPSAEAMKPASLERQLEDAKNALNCEILKGKTMMADLKDVSAKHIAKAEECNHLKELCDSLKQELNSIKAIQMETERLFKQDEIQLKARKKDMDALWEENEHLRAETTELKQTNARLDGLCDESKRIITQNTAQLKVDKIDIDSLREQNEQLHAQIVELKNSPRQIVSDPELQQKYEATSRELESLKRDYDGMTQSYAEAHEEAATLRGQVLNLEKIAEKYKNLMIHFGEKYASEVLGLFR